jgi:hypothetical protein
VCCAKGNGLKTAFGNVLVQYEEDFVIFHWLDMVCEVLKPVTEQD